MLGDREPRSGSALPDRRTEQSARRERRAERRVVEDRVVAKAAVAPWLCRDAAFERAVGRLHDLAVVDKHEHAAIARSALVGRNAIERAKQLAIVVLVRGVRTGIPTLTVMSSQYCWMTVISCLARSASQSLRKRSSHP